MNADAFHSLISLLDLKEIRPLMLHCERLGLISGELNLEWKQAYANDDPLRPNEKTLAFRPKYELVIKKDGAEVFRQVSTFVIGFEIKDSKGFDELWANEEVKKTFKEKQVQRILWPIFRQHVLDGMSRLGVNQVTLPWIV